MLKISFKEDRLCAICKASETCSWYRHSEHGQYICNKCYNKQKYYIEKRANKNGLE